MKQKQKERWVKLRAKGMPHFVLRGIVVSALCAVAGRIVWWLLMIFWRGEYTPRLIGEPGSAIAMVVGFAFAGYLQSTREWDQNESEYLATVEPERNERADV